MCAKCCMQSWRPCLPRSRYLMCGKSAIFAYLVFFSYLVFAVEQEQARVIGFLTELGVDQDPAKFCLEKQQAFVLQELQSAEAHLRATLDAANQQHLVRAQLLRPFF